MAKGASSEALSTAFQEHLEQTKGHVQRLEKIFELLGKTARAEHCKAMEGLIEERSDLLEEEGSAMVKDAALIGAAQRVEHYEIAAYGTTRTLAEMLGQDEAVELLQQILDEEKETDEKLTELAMTEIKQDSEEPSEGQNPRKSPRWQFKARIGDSRIDVRIVQALRRSYTQHRTVRIEPLAKHRRPRASQSIKRRGVRKPKPVKAPPPSKE